MPTKSICIKGKLVELSAPLVMGIVNVTPDSFFEGSRKQTEEEIVQRCRQIVEEGGAIIDVGAQSTNPHSEWLTAPQEAARLMPALRLIRKEFPDAVLSVDTFYADVARQAVEEYGADIINDVSGGQIDADMFATAAALNVPYILMHMRGVPQTMQQHTDYEHFIQELIYYFSEKKAQLDQLGVNDIIIDPGFGFSKTLNQNYELMAYLKYFNIFD
ncbi:MAG TPA: dihydropteroate synthase, partial [Porphyromonadaceae bacterium]|nr:dihydropteroate synthase [Porphyromonadaceae bacterium]